MTWRRCVSVLASSPLQGLAWIEKVTEPSPASRPSFLGDCPSASRLSVGSSIGNFCVTIAHAGRPGPGIPRRTGSVAICGVVCKPEGHGRCESCGALYRLEMGNFSNVKGVGGGVFERKVDFGPGYRIYFGKDGESVVILLGGSSKQRQREAIGTARERWTDYKRRKGTL